MSGLGIPGFIVGVASLLSSCVEAFAYFKVAQRADSDVEILLLKLDIEKTRLLVWGDQSGIFSVNQQHHNLLDESTTALLGKILVEIEKLLTDAEKLRSYGLRAPEIPLGGAIDYVSSKSLAIFRASSSRFWTRNASRLSTNIRGSVVARTRWAIYEKEKFQGLVNHVKDFVDTIYDLVPIDRAVQDSIIVADIESILDISHLKIVEAATEDSYRVYSKAASSTIESTEAGTIDRRTLEKRLRDAELAPPNLTNQPPKWESTHSSVSDALLMELEKCVKHFVLTSSCHRRHTPSPCDNLQLGSQAASYNTYQLDTQWDISSRNEGAGNTLWQLTNSLIGINSIVEGLQEEGDLIGTLLKEKDDLLSNTQLKYLEALLPLVRVYIYCSPCVCLIHTALTICRNVSSTLVAISIRPDDRLVASCCLNFDRERGLKSILEWVREWEAKATADEICIMARFLDRVWVERRLEHLEYEQPYEFVEDGKCLAIVIGEADYLTPLLQHAPGRIPRAMDIWHLKNKYPSGYTRQLDCRFIESYRIAAHTTEQVGRLTSQGLEQVEYEAPVLKRSSSPMSSESKRQNKSAETESQGEEIADREEGFMSLEV